MSELNSELKLKIKILTLNIKAYSELNAAIYGPGNTAGLHQVLLPHLKLYRLLKTADGSVTVSKMEKGSSVGSLPDNARYKCIFKRNEKYQ